MYSFGSVIIPVSCIYGWRRNLTIPEVMRNLFNCNRQKATLSYFLDYVTLRSEKIFVKKIPIADRKKINCCNVIQQIKREKPQLTFGKKCMSANLLDAQFSSYGVRRDKVVVVYCSVVFKRLIRQDDPTDVCSSKIQLLSHLRSFKDKSVKLLFSSWNPRLHWPNETQTFTVLDCKLGMPPGTPYVRNRNHFMETCTPPVVSNYSFTSMAFISLKWDSTLSNNVFCGPFTIFSKSHKL